MPRIAETVKYSDELIADVTKRRNADQPWRGIGEDLGQPWKPLKAAWQARQKRLRDGFDPTTQDFEARAAKIIFEGTKDKAAPTWDRCLDGMAAAQDFRKQFSISDRKVTCRIPAKGPIGIVFVTDVHIGSPHTDYTAFRADINAILASPHLYVMKGGDWCDKFLPGFKDAAAPANQLAPPIPQIVTEDEVMKALNGRIVAACGGNHDRFGEKRTGINDEYFIHRDKPFPYMPTGGRIDLTVGKVGYSILWTHQYGVGNSRLNQHNVFNWIRRELDPTCDIYALEHHHDPSMLTREVNDFGKRQVLEIRTGSYKIDDRFSQQFFKEGRPGPQTVVLWPDQHKMIGFHGASAIGDATTYLDGVYYAKTDKEAR